MAKLLKSGLLRSDAKLRVAGFPSSVAEREVKEMHLSEEKWLGSPCREQVGAAFSTPQLYQLCLWNPA
jgi:hypothetical protein